MSPDLEYILARRVLLDASYLTAFARYLSRLGCHLTGAVSWPTLHPLEPNWVNAWDGSCAKRPGRDGEGSRGATVTQGARRLNTPVTTRNGIWAKRPGRDTVRRPFDAATDA